MKNLSKTITTTFLFILMLPILISSQEIKKISNNQNLSLNKFKDNKISKEDTTQTSHDQNQEIVQSYQSGTSFYLELLGKGFYSINIDYRKSKSTAFSFGAQYGENAFWPSLIVLPVESLFFMQKFFNKDQLLLQRKG